MNVMKSEWPTRVVWNIENNLWLAAVPPIRPGKLIYSYPGFSIVEIAAMDYNRIQKEVWRQSADLINLSGYSNPSFLLLKEFFRLGGVDIIETKKDLNLLDKILSQFAFEDIENEINIYPEDFSRHLTYIHGELRKKANMNEIQAKEWAKEQQFQEANVTSIEGQYTNEEKEKKEYIENRTEEEKKKDDKMFEDFFEEINKSKEEEKGIVGKFEDIEEVRVREKEENKKTGKSYSQLAREKQAFFYVRAKAKYIKEHPEYEEIPQEQINAHYDHVYEQITPKTKVVYKKKESKDKPTKSE